MATIPTPEQGKPILDFSAGTFDGNSYLFQSRNGATEHVSGDDVADYVNTSRIYNGLETESKTPVGAINEVNRKDASDISYDNTSSGLSATDVQGAIDEVDEKTGSDIAVSSSSSETIAEAIEAITPSDTVLSAAWIAQGQTTGDTPLTDYLTLTKGFYFVIVAYPVLDTNDNLLCDIIGGNITKWGGSFIQLSSQQNSVRLVRVNADTRIRVNSMQSKTVNFTYLDRGGLFAYRLA